MAWLAVNSSYSCADKVNAIKEYVKKNGIDNLVLPGSEGKIGKLYQAQTTPHLFVLPRRTSAACRW